MKQPEIDPYKYFHEITADPNTLIMIAGPIVLGIVILLTYVLIAASRRKKEEEALLKEMILEDIVDATPPPPISAIEPVKTEEPISVKEEPKEPDLVDEIKQTDQKSWLSKLKNGLSKTRGSLTASLSSLFTGKVKIDEETLERLHEILYRADIGVSTADKLVDRVRQELGKEESTDWPAVKKCLCAQIEEILSKAHKPLELTPKAPFVILVVGVNGVGKTTSIGKLAAHYLAENKSVMLCAADTFRAAAIEQLQVWGDRLGVEVIKHAQGSDPAAVAYDAVKAAKARNTDVLLIDTAGRLHNKSELMQELAKIKRVIGKDHEGAPHETWLVIDATTGQNAMLQVKAFQDVVALSGLVVTKLDGTAKGGVLIGITDKFQMPIRYIGVGEKASDLRDFKPMDYSESIF